MALTALRNSSPSCRPPSSRRACSNGARIFSTMRGAAAEPPGALAQLPAVRRGIEQPVDVVDAHALYATSASISKRSRCVAASTPGSSTRSAASIVDVAEAPVVRRLAAVAPGREAVMLAREQRTIRKPLRRRRSIASRACGDCARARTRSQSRANARRASLRCSMPSKAAATFCSALALRRLQARRRVAAPRVRVRRQGNAPFE